MHRKTVSIFQNHPANLLAAFIATAFYAAALWSTPALSQNMKVQQANPMAKITVYATGTASAKPDMALLNFSVSHDADTAKQAMDQTSAGMAGVIEALEAAGIKAKDMQTAGLTVQPLHHADNDASETSAKQRYRAINTLNVKVHDLGKLGQIVDDAMNGGANGIGQMSLANADPLPFYETARKNAVAEAFAKAKTLADASGATLGRVWRIEENSAAVEPLARMAMSSAPVVAGENSYNVNISLTAELVSRK